MSDGTPQPLTRRQLREQERQLEAVAAERVPSAALPSPAALPVAQATPPLQPSTPTTRRPSRTAATHPPTRGRVVAAKPVRSIRSQVASKIFSTAALLFAGALLVGTSVPANAFMGHDDSVTTTTTATADATLSASSDIAASAQQLEVSPNANALPGASSLRGNYKVTAPAQIAANRYVAQQPRSYSLSKGPVRWPFPNVVPTSDGYGPRAAPCAGCSTFHHGLDFLPGDGSPIFAVASGTVSKHGLEGSLGNVVILDHVIDGVPVQSVYGHMRLQSSPLRVGQKVKVGDFIGLVGATGSATAPHLHLEIHVSGVPVDPYAWLLSHAG